MLPSMTACCASVSFSPSLWHGQEHVAVSPDAGLEIGIYCGGSIRQVSAIDDDVEPVVVTLLQYCLNTRLNTRLKRFSLPKGG